MELLGAFLTGVVGPIMYLLISKYMQKEKDKKRDKVKENIANTSLISDELEEIREEFKSDRVWISQFHNGGNFLSHSKSIQKFSIFYEVTKQHLFSITYLQQYTLFTLSKTFHHMMEGNGLFIPDFNDPKVATYGLKGYRFCWYKIFIFSTTLHIG